MRNYLLLGASLALALALSCNQPAEDSAAPAAAVSGGQVASTRPITTEANVEICPGCGKPESECTCGEGSEATAKLPPAPTEIKLANDSVVKVVGVAAVNADPKLYAGVFAIDGTVGELFADKGTFMLVDCVAAAQCSDPGCASCSADMKLPVRVDLASLKGSLPDLHDRVLVVAEVKPTSTGGFDLKVREIREGEATLCTVEVQSNPA